VGPSKKTPGKLGTRLSEESILKPGLLDLYILLSANNIIFKE